MATFKWAGDVVAVAQVDTLTVGGTVEADDLFLITIGGKILSVTAGDTDVDTVAATIATAFEASTEPEFVEVAAVASGSGGTLTLTSNTEGKPFTATVSTTEAGGGAADDQTFVSASTTANDGPNVWSANNFIDQSDGSRGTLPGAGDTVLIEDSNVDIKFNLDQSGAGADLTEQIFASYTGQIGLPEVNSDGTAYTEYRPRELHLDTDTLKIGEGAGNGSPKLRFKTSEVISTLTVFSTGAAAANESAVEVLVTSDPALTLVEIFSGSVQLTDDLAPGGGNLTLTTLSLNGDSAVSLVGGFAGVVTTININDTAVLTLPTEFSGTPTTINLRGGTLISNAADNITTLNLFAGTFVAQQSGTFTVTTVTIGPTGILDTTLAAGVITLTNTTLNGDQTGGGELRDPNARLVFTNPIDIGFGKVLDFPIDVGAGRTVTFSDPT